MKQPLSKMMMCVNALKIAKSVYQLSLKWDNYRDCISSYWFAIGGWTHEQDFLAYSNSKKE